MITFPQDVWFMIKSYEYQMIHYPVFEKIIKELSFHSYMPYYLSIHKDKGGDKLFSFMLSKKSMWEWYYTERVMEKLCYKYDRIARDNYD